MNKKPSGIFDKLKEPRIRHGSMSVLITFLVIVFVVALNFLAHYFTDKYSLNYDLTQNKVFSLTEDSIDYLGKIEKDVEVIVLNDKDSFAAINDYFKQANDVINEYSKHNGRISVSYVNIEKDPNFKSNYPEDELDSNNIIVKCGDKHTVLSASDLFNVQQTYTDVKVSSKAEQAMTSAIMNVVSNERVKITVLSGFDESDISGFISLLDKNNFEVVTKSLVTEDIDEDCQVALICGPKRDYDKEAVTKVKDYLYNKGNYGKNILYFINPLLESTPNIEVLINEWGIKTHPGRVFESDMSKFFIRNNPYSTLAEYSASTYSDGIKNKSIPVAVPISRQIEITDENKVTALLEFSKSSGIVPDNAGNDWNPSESDIKGPLPAMVLSSYKGENESAKPSTLTVTGSVQSLDQEILSRTAFNNSSYFLNLINNLTERKDTVNIEPKSIGSQELTLNFYQAIVLGIVFAAAVPIIVLAAGVIVWLIRRKN